MSLLPDRHNFTFWKGATFRTQLTLFIDKGVTRRDLTGYTASLVIKQTPEGATLLTLNTGNGGITLHGDTGVIELYIGATTTAGVNWTSGVYNLTITESGGDTDALLWGNFLVKGI